MKKVVFLDRDGVINRNPAKHDYVKNWKEFILLPDVVKAIKKIKRMGFLVIVITNQRGVARGLMTEKKVNKIHEKLNEELKKHDTQIDAFYWCRHDYSDNCSCRKPAPGLLQAAAKNFNIDLATSWFIGDSKTDLLCGQNAGVKTIIMPTNSSLLEVIEKITAE